jgi:plastocyanin
MAGTRLVALSSLACMFALSASAAAQDPRSQDVVTPTSKPHTIVIALVERPGAMPFAFEPASFSAHRGDTLRFVQAASAMHNVHFKTQPKGAKLGSAAMSQYLTTKGQSYTLVVDSRFVDGTYEIVCDPHETIGMHAMLSVVGAPSVVAGKP